MKRKLKFMQAVRILAPDDQFIHQAAERVREGALPAFPGGAASSSSRPWKNFAAHPSKPDRMDPGTRPGRLRVRAYVRQSSKRRACGMR